MCQTPSKRQQKTDTMTKRKALTVLALLSALVCVTFVVLATRMSPTENPNKEAAPATVSTPLPEKDAHQTTNAWLVVRGMAVKRAESWNLSREETVVRVEVSMDEVGDYGYDRNAPIQVEEEKRFFTVTFAEPPHPGPPELICCADFAIKVRFDKGTRKVAEIECGG